jgi:hypothetical protein
MYEWGTSSKTRRLHQAPRVPTIRCGLLARVHSTVAKTIYYGDPRWNDRNNPYRYDHYRRRVA